MTATAGGPAVAPGAGIDAREIGWDELVAHCAPYVHAVMARAHGLTGRDAQAAFEEVFLRLWVHLDPWPQDRAAVRAKVAALACEVAAERAGPDAQPPPAGVLRELDEALSVREAMLALAPEDRELLERRLERGETEAQVAHALGIPVEAVDERVRTAREQLRRELGWNG